MELALAKSIDLGLEQHEELWLETQSSALHSIVYNLLDNAIKYTPEQGVINVSIYQQDQQAIVQIEDSGPGIEPEFRADALRPFVRLEGSRNRSTGGTGLGLAIASDIILGHGGEMTLDDSPLGGLRVTVQLPI